MTDEILLEAEDKMKKAIDVMENRFLNVRAGRANPRILDKVEVVIYDAGKNVSNSNDNNDSANNDTINETEIQRINLTTEQVEDLKIAEEVEHEFHIHSRKWQR